jgi:hypothetical protein
MDSLGGEGECMVELFMNTQKHKTSSVEFKVSPDIPA